MAQLAYDLERFAASQPKPPAPRLRVAKKVNEVKNARRSQVLRMVRTLLAVAVVAVLVWAVLFTQAKVAELSSEIVQTEKALKEEKALNAYLTFELDNMTSLKNIEERAAELGLEKMNNGQVSYYRVEENNGIQVKEGPLAQLFANAKSGMQNILEHLVP